MAGCSGEKRIVNASQKSKEQAGKRKNPGKETAGMLTRHPSGFLPCTEKQRIQRGGEKQEGPSPIRERALSQESVAAVSRMYTFWPRRMYSRHNSLGHQIGNASEVHEGTSEHLGVRCTSSSPPNVVADNLGVH